MKLPKVIYVMGLPGAGKGTQAEMLAHDVGYQRFSTGNAFRQIAMQDTPLGREVKEIIDNGFLTPAALAAKVVVEATKEFVERGDGLVFDGTPRTLEEAKIIDASFKAAGYEEHPLVIYLEVDKETMIERNSKRKVCLDIAEEFPVVTEQDEARCIELGGRVGSRPDDEREKFTTRHDQFMELTYPSIEEYRSRHDGYYFVVDGMPAMHRVHASIMDIIRQFEI